MEGAGGGSHLPRGCWGGGLSCVRPNRICVSKCLAILSPQGNQTVFRGWLFAQGEQCWGLLEEGQGWGPRVPPPLQLWIQPRADECIKWGVIYVCRHHEGEDVMARQGGRREEGGKSKENFLYGSLASAKQERCLFSRVRS